MSNVLLSIALWLAMSASEVVDVNDLIYHNITFRNEDGGLWKQVRRLYQRGSTLSIFLC